MNKYAKAIVAMLSALVAAVTTRVPINQTEWLQAIAVAIGAGLVTGYVPNTTPTVVIPPKTLTDNTPELAASPTPKVP